MINVYVTNLGKYTEGELIGQWLTLPTSEEEIKDTMENIRIKEGLYEEFFITDSECEIEAIEIGEYENLDNLNTIAENLSNLTSYEIEQIKALLEGGYIDKNDILENNFDLDNYFFLELDNDLSNTDIALGYALADLNDIESKLGDLSAYFDYEKYGRDARFNGAFISSNNIAILQ